MSIIDDLTAKVTDTVADATETVTDAAGGMGSMVSGMMGGSMVSNAVKMAADATDLDEKAIAMFEEKVGAGKFAEMKAMLADGKITKEEVSKIATDAGVPDSMVSMIMKFI